MNRINRNTGKQAGISRFFLLTVLLFSLGRPAAAQTNPLLADLFTPPLAPGGTGPGHPRSLWKIPLPASYPARCGDGSLPVFYLRAALPGSLHPNDWVFHLPGGGSNTDPDEILRMWMGVGHKSGGGPTHLSSLWANESKPAEGIHSADAANPFADFNQVFIDKCTLDLFTGTATASLTTTADITDLSGATTVPAGTTYDVAFGGRQIIEGVIDYLKNPPSSPLTYFPCSGGEVCPAVSLPDLDAAVEILWTGSSGGGSSAIHSADWVAAFLPNAHLRLVVDAAFHPGAELMDDYHNPKGSADISLYEGEYGFDPEAGTASILFYSGSESITFQTWGAGRDTSCMAFHDATAGGDGNQWKCTDEIHVLMHHVTLPFFIRNDRNDPNLTNNGNCWSVEWNLSGSCYYNLNKYSLGVGYQMDDLLLFMAEAEEAASMTAAPSGFAPRCRQHVGLTSNVAFFQNGIDDSGIDRNFVDVLWDWYANGWSGVLIEPTASGPLPGSC
ncbi:MAG: pectin acetylesterase-family hydrolase [Candidatus Manganitrophaceae bacterium]